MDRMTLEAYTIGENHMSFFLYVANLISSATLGSHKGIMPSDVYTINYISQP